jgi:phosphoglycolate phosphatase-like HAD superfamily hydrolase
MTGNDYKSLEINNKIVFIKKGSIKKLSQVDAVIFDCDGVLIDVSKSYFEAIKNTINYIFTRTVNKKALKEDVLDDLIYIFKKSGGFNNDWDTTFVIILLIFSNLPDEAINKLQSIAYSKKFVEAQDPKEKLNLIRENLLDLGNFLLSEHTFRKINNIAKKSLSSGLGSFSNRLFNELLIDRKKINSITKLFTYPGTVKESFLTAIFEEIFLGCALFKKIYGIDCTFHKGKGLIENEKVILDKKILDSISRILGKFNFGIASGRPFYVSEYTLKNLLNEFRPNSRIFLEEIGKAEHNANKSGINLGKPHPFALTKCTEGLLPFKFALYLGDSMEDAIMVERANFIDQCYLFCGVYSYSIKESKQISDFLEKGADLIIPSVVELPTILSKIKRYQTIA